MSTLEYVLLRLSILIDQVNFLYIPEVSGLILTSSAVATRYILDVKKFDILLNSLFIHNARPGKVQPQMFGGEVSIEPIPFRLLRTILFHQTHYDKGRLTLA